MAPLALLATAAVLSPAAAPAAVEAAQASDEVAELARLYESRDYFALRERLDDPSPDDPPEVHVLRAATAHAFNDLDRSNRLLAPLLSGGTSLSDSLRHEARRIRGRNLLRLYRYAEAARTFEELTAGAPAWVDSSAVDDYRNTLRLTRALEDVPPQRVAARSRTVLARTERGEVPVTIGDSVGHYGIDTGANLSVLVRSEADRLGLEIREAGLDVGSSTDVRVTADLAVADRVRMGDVLIENAVFLVLPDEVFTFPGRGLVLRGLVGFPVVEALGELRYRKGGPVVVPEEVPDRALHNLALHDLTPYVRVGYEGDPLVCVLDTGSDETMFYEPFYRRYRSRIEAEGSVDTTRYGGAGGVRELPGYRLEEVTLRVGGGEVTLAGVHVHSTVLTGSRSSNVLDCNLGHDVVSSADEYVLNFRTMSVLLRRHDGG